MELLLKYSSLLNAVVTLVAGITALVVYLLSKRHERKSAATILLMDIRNAESVVLSIKDKGLDLWTKEILTDNNWNKLKHLFVGEFSNDEIAAFNRFFDSCSEMKDARSRMRDLFYTTLTSKAQVYQQKVYEIEDINSPQGMQKQQELFQNINRDYGSFDADEPKQRFMKNLELMGALSSTTGFIKLKKCAGEKA
ncbi:hypothetical protein CGG78_23930 [Vibrio parahaemolyticus]|uniref:hypothetical protein n=4 Tax=Vibrio parahaemolyticus TaxID=670 RepID=UPI00111D8CCA|nr:hypothetical protein [Vibrio parahaemolyticus]MBE3816866.1 hypothetical protein [Vibrio parahaemolyticus]MBE3884689.1 hypothetical protein [Vibrio parahaemolyticus]MBE4178179.1 hypothetical protein [Vibrio parahaemolyticus]MBE4236442.1 hypothetical protein [Vibrio parahaemolyticus]MBE4263317.1 hypothetical protein [Vibrio parahaemolyticus]